jgi:hypothetical protein
MLIIFIICENRGENEKDFVENVKSITSNFLVLLSVIPSH